jgi:DNA-binding MarR family transcriptional regulator
MTKPRQTSALDKKRALASVVDDTPLQRFLTYRLATLTSKLNRQATAILAAVSGLKLAEWRVIALLALNGEMNGVRIAEVSGIDTGLLSRTIFTLEKRAIVRSRRSTTDRRVVLVTLTPQGRGVYDTTLPHMRARQKHLLAHLTAAERTTMLTVIEKLEIAADTVSFAGDAT